MALELFQSTEKVEILLDDVQDRKTSMCFDQKKNLLRLPIYTQDDSSLSGKVKLNLSNKKLKHTGIFIQLIGETQTYHILDKPEVFLFQSLELQKAGTLQSNVVFDFAFGNFEKLYETYYGLTGRVRYFLRAMICRELDSPITTDLEFAVQLPLMGVMYNQGFEIQLRIADYLMIDVELNKINFHLDECLIGKITINQIQLVIKKIQVSLVRREIFMPGLETTCTKEDVLCKIKLSEKCPKRGDIIPFKMNLSSLELSPSLLQCNPKLVTKYILILSFIDEAQRSLFKPVELNLWRKK